jgi:hypothetical protein
MGSCLARCDVVVSKLGEQSPSEVVRLYRAGADQLGRRPNYAQRSLRGSAQPKQIICFLIDSIAQQNYVKPRKADRENGEETDELREKQRGAEDCGVGGRGAEE